MVTLMLLFISSRVLRDSNHYVFPSAFYCMLTHLTTSPAFPIFPDVSNWEKSWNRRNQSMLNWILAHWSWLEDLSIKWLHLLVFIWGLPSFYCFCFWDRDFLCRPSWHSTCVNPSASAAPVLGLLMNINMFSLAFFPAQEISKRCSVSLFYLLNTDTQI